MVDPVTIATGAVGAVGGGGLSLWLTKLMVRRTMAQYDEGLKDIRKLQMQAAVQEALSCEIVKPLRAEVAELRERVAKAEAANKKAMEADGILNRKLNDILGR